MATAGLEASALLELALLLVGMGALSGFLAGVPLEARMPIRGQPAVRRGRRSGGAAALKRGVDDDQ